MKVLIIDYSLIVRERLEAMLSEVLKVENITSEKDQLEALGLLKKLNPKVVELDIEMPSGSGIDLLRQLKKRKQPLLTVVLTNLSDSHYRKKCMDAGADFFVDKSREFDKVGEVLSWLN